MPIGRGTVLIGMGERTTRQAVFQVAEQLFKQQAATRVIACLMPKSRPAMHLDTVFTFCDRDLCTSFREVADQIRCYSARPTGDGNVEIHPTAASLRHRQRCARTEKTARRGDRWQWLGTAARTVGRGQQRRRARARRRRQLRPEYSDEHLAAQSRHRGDHSARCGARPRQGGGHCMTCPISRDSAYS